MSEIDPGEMPAQEALTLLDYFAAHVDIPYEIAVIKAKQLIHREPNNGEIADMRAVLKYLEASRMVARREVLIKVPVGPLDIEVLLRTP